MNYFLISATINALTSYLIFFLVLLNNPKSPKNRSFAYFAFFVAIWATFYQFWIIDNIKETALFYMRISVGFAIFIPASFFHFTANLIDEYKKYKRTIFLLYAFSFIIFLTAPTNLFIFDAKNILMFHYWPMAGITYNFHVLNYFITPIYGFLIIHKKIKDSSIYKSKQLKLVLVGILLAYVGGATNFPLNYSIPIPPIGNMFVSLYTILIAYAAFRYQLMDFRIIIKKSLVYTLLITSITIIYLISIYFAEHILQSMLGYKSLLISIILATVIALIFIPLKNLIQNLIEKSLFRGSYTQIAEENELLRQEVIQTERLKSVAILASGMAHEIKNPLTVLKTFSEYLPKKLDDKAFLIKFAPMISYEVNRIDHLVHELLDFARPAEPILKPTNLHDLLNSTLELLSNDYIKHQVRIDKNYQIDTRLMLPLDHNQIRQALLNVFLNAIDAMPKGGYLTIITSTIDDTRINIKIQDTGVGIDHTDLNHIFDPFFTKKDGGTGLGLSVTYEIIKKHSGKIFVESILQKGTSFIIELPTIPPS